MNEEVGKKKYKNRVRFLDDFLIDSNSLRISDVDILTPFNLQVKESIKG